MSIKDIIWPWGRIKALKNEVSMTRAYARGLESVMVELKDDLNEATTQYKHEKLERIHLEALLKKAHFRDPKTGRYGKQGQYK